MAAAVQRQPFGELGASRLQALTSKKNTQNAITESLLSEKTKPVLSSPSKRSYTPAFEDEDFDSENVDPLLMSSKRAKGSDGSSFKKPQPMFSLTTTSSTPLAKVSNQMTHSVDRPTVPSIQAPSKPTLSSNAYALPSGTSSAPAGRSPKHKRVGILSKKRPFPSSYKRVDPPTFGIGKKSSTSGQAFSIDAALSGTLSTYQPSAPPASQSTVPKALTFEKPMPKAWFFDIHEDTPDEEAANLMEHSTCTLDISSDDEAGPSRKDHDRGKENVPPPDHDAIVAATANVAPQHVPAKARRSVDADAMADAGDERAPLGALAAEDFYGRGLDATSIEVVQPDVETKVEPAGADEAQQHDDAEDELENDENALPHTPVSPLEAVFKARHQPDVPMIAVLEDEAEKAIEVTV